jgi:hypothetical protein
VSAAVVGALLSLVAAIAVGWVVPAIAMRMLMPAFASSERKVRNYRGVEVSAGLGTVWLVWALLVLLVAVKVDALGGLPWFDFRVDVWIAWTVAPLLVVFTFAFGLIDDVFGGSDAKGFRGHLTAMLRGKLTTGGLKLLGIGLVSALAAFLGQGSWADKSGTALVASAASWVLGTLVIALAANLVNLTDLQPGRALKVYLVLIAVSVPGLVVTAFRRLDFASAPGWQMVAVSIVLVVGPVLAVWRYDLGERGILGDAGANAMGALAGYLLATNLPLWGLATATIILLAFNLLSEKVSFSRVIEGNALLRWIDGLGRLKDVDTRKDGAI